jgi:hypothetical protein
MIRIVGFVFATLNCIDRRSSGPRLALHRSRAGEPRNATA